MASRPIPTTSVTPYRAEDDHWIATPAPGAPAPRFRHDGWTPFRQQVFLRSIAEGKTVELACAGVGLSPTSAYAFRNRASGAAFALGWAAANLLARERLADMLMTRVIEGQIETVSRPDGTSVDRLKYDNRLALGLLTRLDRQADAGNAATQAARLIAQEFEAFTDAIGRDDSPARAGLFVGARAAADAGTDLAPVLALARADRFARTGASMAMEVDVSDLDLSARARWTADQWQRAEAAGLLTLAPAPANDDEAIDDEEAEFSSAQDPQLPDEDFEDEPVWYEASQDSWVTCFPPPESFDGWENHQYGDPLYTRSLTAEELTAHLARTCAEERAAGARERDLWFGFVEAGPIDKPEITPS